MAANTLANDAFTRPASGGFDPTNVQVANLRILNAIFTSGYWYGDLSVGIAPGNNLMGAINTPDLTSTGTITAAQPNINTTVANASVVLAVGTGQASWKATLTGANFTSGSTIYVDHSSDGGTTYFASSFKVVGQLQTTTVQSIVGPAPIELSGNDAGVSHVRVRCGTLNTGDSISVALRAGNGLAVVGLNSSIPAGSSPIGSITNTAFTATQKAVSSATLTNVSVTTATVVLLAANANRSGVYVFNDGTANLYLAFAGTASLTSWTVKIAAGGFFEMPTSPVYTGAISGVCDSATNTARITEL